jgi:hypothetical protein
MRPILILTLLMPAAAHAAIACQYHEQAVALATVIVQIDAVAVTGPDENGDCGITGTVQRSFLGDLALGSTVTTTTPCDATILRAPGPQIYTDFGVLSAARVIELHLTDGAVASYGAGLAVLDALTDAPARPNMCGE